MKCSNIFQGPDLRMIAPTIIIFTPTVLWTLCCIGCSDIYNIMFFFYLKNRPPIIHYLSLPVTAIHNWHGDVQCGLPLDVGDSVEILEECGDWYRGTCPRRPRTVGLFPKSYIHIKDLSKTDPVVAECTQVLREWSEIWKQLFVVSHLMDKLK